MKVLIVDDNQKMRSLIADLVKKYADEVVECGDGVEAVAQFNRHLPDWVLMDVRMKTMDGIAATRAIHQSHPEAKIAIVTQDDNAPIREKARLAGAAAFVPKENLLEIRNLFKT